MSTTATIVEAAGSDVQLPSTDGPAAKEHWFVPLFNAGDLDGLMTHFATDAVLVTKPDAVVSGLDGVREFFREIMWNKLMMAGTTTRIVRSDDLAMLSFDWTLTEYPGTHVSAEGTAIMVMRRQDDGKWLIVIDDPFSLVSRHRATEA